MKEIKMVDLFSHYLDIKDEISVAFHDIFDHSTFVKGPQVDQFSKDLKNYLNVAHVIPCANGTDALQIALMALELKPGNEVITTPFTFVSTVEVIALLGLKPVFVDIDAETFNLSADQIESKITPRTKAIIPVHLFGQSAAVDPIMQLADEHQLFVVEDNAQAMGAEYISRDGLSSKTGTLGHIGTTSFFPSKNLACFGDGGALFTDNDELAGRMNKICNHGSSEKYHHELVGVNSRLDSLQAAVLIANLKRLDHYNQKRLEAANYYDELLNEVEGVRTPRRSNRSTHIFHQYTLRIKNKRESVTSKFKASDIPYGIYYPIPLHLQKAYVGYGYKRGDFPNAERISEEVISLPIHPYLTRDQQEFIVDQLIKAIAGN
nr:DegT/DnrJ/EryC1/StrS family aminotransferase [Saprospiraceae bacterium]